MTCVGVAGGVFGKQQSEEPQRDENVLLASAPAVAEKGTWFRHVVTRIQERGALFGHRGLHSIDEWDMSHGTNRS